MERIEEPSIQKVILDAGPIIHLDEIECLSLLLDFKELLVPEAVWDEVQFHRSGALQNKTIPFEKVSLETYNNAQILMLCNAFGLDQGEEQAILLSFQCQHAAILLTDDAAARLAAKAAGIRAYGTIGMLLRSIRRKQLTLVRVIKLLEEIPSKSTLYIKHTLLQDIIVEVKKEYSP